MRTILIYKIISRSKLVVLGILLTIIIIYVFYSDHTTEDNIEEHIEHELQKLYELIPVSTTLCENLFQGFTLPFESERLEFDKITQNYGYGEGHSGQVKAQTLFYYHVSKMDFDLTVCEIGFNLGHSAFMWLRSSWNTRLYSFDLGRYHATRPMADYLKSMFKERFHIIYGDSTETVPEFSKNNPHFTCDVLVVDGGHTYNVAKADLLNMQKLANRKRNIVIFDDCPSTMFGDELVKVWEEMLEKNIIESIFECSIRSRDRGFSVGRYKFE